MSSANRKVNDIPCDRANRTLINRKYRRKGTYFRDYEGMGRSLQEAQKEGFTDRNVSVRLCHTVERMYMKFGVYMKKSGWI
jgi:hypothetical protein